MAIESWFFLSTMAFALSMDAFSMSLAVAMKRKIPVNKMCTALVVGLFHMGMPFLGLISGTWIAASFEQTAMMVAGVLLFVIGLQMIVSSWKKDAEQESMILPVGLGVFIFSFFVSLDSFSIGITLGILKAELFSVLLLFGLFSGIFTWLGLTLGKYMQQSLGRYGEMIGGIILLSFGLKLAL